MRPDYDILIIGGGMVGACAAALAAAEPELTGLRIALLEPRPPAEPPSEDDVDLRVSALSRASERILRSVGAWDLIPSRFLSAYADMRVWDRAGKPFGAASIHFSASFTSEPNLGHIVENRRIQWALFDAPAFRERVTILRAELASLEFGRDQAIAGLADGRSVSAAVVIGADGAQSRSRDLAGLATAGWDYDQHAFVTHVRTTIAHQRTAWQRFLSDGPIAFLPLADGRSSIVWTTRPDHAQRLITADASQVAAELSAALDGALGDVEIAGGRGAFPLRLVHARSYCRERFALVGDAAHAVHPLAGQGVNLGFLDCAALIEELSAAVAASGADALGDLRVLRRYERWRKSENTLALGLIDGLNRLFTSSSAFVQWGRRFGLSAVDGSGLAKKFFMGRALGVEGELPRAARAAGVRR